MPRSNAYPLRVAKRKPRGVVESIVGRNLDALMAYYPALKSNHRVAAKIGGAFPARTVGRIKNAETSCSLDTLAKLAKAFDVEPWHLLVPNYDPKNPPVRTMTQAERQFYASVKADFQRVDLSNGNEAPRSKEKATPR